MRARGRVVRRETTRVRTTPGDMYRSLVPVFLYVSAVATAPQNANSDITYVKIQPAANNNQPPSVSLRESRIDNLPLNISGNNVTNSQEESGQEDVNRPAVSEYTTAYYDTTETDSTTERDESLEELIQQTEEYESHTKAPAPRFLSKLSYFQKPDVGISIPTNLVERTAKRRFKSTCRCEKIWNCPKLQISVPRCPNEYFMCCL